MLETTPRKEQVHRRAMLRQTNSTRVTCESIELETTAAPGFHDITEDIEAIVADSGVSFGQVTVFSCHTTAAIRINENEPLLLRDLARTLRQIAPLDAYYEHNDFGRRTVNMHEDEPANGHAHCQHLFLSTSETIPIVDGKTSLGAYQRVFLIELDHPRMRKVLVNVVGC
ncbi:MAG TPA: secondary thiamine-phosphate synthase enzyme YjbQ [Dehalococcoidia bacterium]|nr:secondary thiamine-phosphate synthase enzyme YjbQ [Dehalococcoidia bacterium]